MALASQSTASIAQHLSGIDFPARKQQLVDYAKQHNADKDVIDVLDKMPDEEYSSMADVFKGVGHTH
jgi:hypothetical protein